MLINFIIWTSTPFMGPTQWLSGEVDPYDPLTGTVQTFLEMCQIRPVHHVVILWTSFVKISNKWKCGNDCIRISNILLKFRLTNFIFTYFDNCQNSNSSAIVSPLCHLVLISIWVKVFHENTAEMVRFFE